MVKVNKLTDIELQHLKKLVNSTIYSNENIRWRDENGYVEEFTILPINHKSNKPKFINKGKYGMGTLIHPYGIENNIEICNFVNKIINRKISDINSVHHVRYIKKTFLPKHTDVHMGDFKFEKTNTIIFLLNMCEVGGEFLLNDIDINFNEPGQYVDFDGATVTHEVKKIIKGIREVLVFWYKPINNSLI